MKTLSYVFVFLATTSCLAQFGKKMNNAASDSTKRKISSNPSVGYVGFGLSVANGSFNNYKVGNANQFYQFLLQDPTLKLDDGAIGFKYFTFGALSLREKTVFGFEFNYVAFHPSHAIAGQNLSLTSGLGGSMHFGGRSLEITCRFGPKLNKNGANISLEIATLYGFMSGSISDDSGNTWTEKGAYDSGLRGGLAIDFPVGKNLILFSRIGYRNLIIEEKHIDSTTGKSGYSFYANGNNGETVKVNWSGKYASLGMGVVIPSKKKT